MGKLLILMLMFEWCKVVYVHGLHFEICHTLNRCKVTYFHEKRHDSYPMQRRNVRKLIFMGKLLILMLMFEWCKVVYFHGLHFEICHTLNRCKVAYFHEKRHDSYLMQ
jgi:hypothetical protein